MSVVAISIVTKPTGALKLGVRRCFSHSAVRFAPIQNAIKSFARCGCTNLQDSQDSQLVCPLSMTLVFTNNPCAFDFGGLEDMSHSLHGNSLGERRPGGISASAGTRQVPVSSSVCCITQIGSECNSLAAWSCSAANLGLADLAS